MTHPAARVRRAYGGLGSALLALSARPTSLALSAVVIAALVFLALAAYTAGNPRVASTVTVTEATTITQSGTSPCTEATQRIPDPEFNVYFFWVDVSYDGPWSAIASVTSDGSVFSQMCYTGDGLGVIFDQSSSLRANSTLEMTVTRLIPSSGPLTVSMGPTTEMTTVSNKSLVISGNPSVYNGTG